MELYGHILLFAMPAFLVLVLFEKWYGYLRNNDTVPVMDMYSSLSSGITNVVKDVLELSVSILAYDFMAKHLALIEIKSSWVVYVIAFIVLDFQGYWVHRIAHEINFFWNKHAIHHSSEEFNLACALRQSISTFVNLFTFFLIPAALLGVPTDVIAIVAPIQLFAQFWYHTRHINKMGFLEHIIVTPSHHRVHHAINKEYLDKNYSQIFIIWDKLFGTFQAELPECPPVYGITRPVSTWNPIKINFQHLWILIKDAWRAQSVKDKLRIWFMPTGWRPADVAQAYPVAKIENIYNFAKYNPPASGALSAWMAFQLVATLLFVSYLFGYIATIGSPGIYLYGGFVFVLVYSYTELMDRNRWAWLYEVIKTVYALVIIYLWGDWFGLDAVVPYATVFVYVYLGISILASIYLNKTATVQHASA